MVIYTPIASLQAFAIAYTQSDFIGKMIILSLIALSMICWIVLIYKVWQAKKVKELSKSFQLAIKQNKERVLSFEIKEAYQQLSSYIPHPFLEIFQALQQKTIDTLNKKLFFAEQTGEKNHPVYLSPADLDILESQALITISMQSKILDRHIFILSTIVTLAPFLGLLGTVWGILISFSSMHAGGQTGSNAAVLGGLSTALSTTVLGLVIAIPALIAYNYLKNNLKSYTTDMEDFSYEVLSTIEMQYRKVDLS